MPISHNLRITIAQALAFPFARPALDGFMLIALVGLVLESLRAALPFGLLQLAVVLPLTFLVWIMLFRLASETLITVAHGEGCRFGHRSTRIPDGLAIRHIGLWLLSALVFGLCLAYFGSIGGLMALPLLVVMLPAATLLLTLRNDFADAFNPVAGKRLIEALGIRDYLRLCWVLAGLALGYVVLDWIGQRSGLPGLLLNVSMLAYWAWALLAWFYLAGRLVYEHRGELELAPADEAEVVAKAKPFSRDPERLWLEIRNQGGTLEMHAALAHSLDQTNDAATRMAHGKMHVAALLSAFEMPEVALQRAGELIETDAGFALEAPSAMLDLIRAASDRDHPTLLAKLIKSYLENFPGSQRSVEVRLLGCEALKEVSGTFRLWAETWYQQLMTASLDSDQRQRLNEIAPLYLQRK